MGDCPRSIRRVGAGYKASCGPLGAYFCWRWPWPGWSCCLLLSLGLQSHPPPNRIPPSRAPPSRKKKDFFFQSQPPQCSTDTLFWSRERDNKGLFLPAAAMAGLVLLLVVALELQSCPSPQLHPPQQKINKDFFSEPASSMLNGCPVLVTRKG